MRKPALCLLLLIWSLLAFAGRPVIGISSSLKDGFDRVSPSYFEAVLAAGGIPVAIPKGAVEVVDMIDGLVMTGGEDVAPWRYGESPVGDCVKVNASRDTSDFAILAAALRKSVPVLCVCRGMQLANVALGGTLWQDIPSQVRKPVQHRAPAQTRPHMVRIRKGSMLRDIVGRDTLSVNTSHHQAVRKPAPGLRVTAKAPDGIVEGYESCPSAGHSIVGVQFHPETFAKDGEEPYLSIYRNLVERASAYAENRSR